MTAFFKQEFHTTSGRVISQNCKPYLILELGLNHNRDEKILTGMIEQAAELKADAIKLQSYTSEKFIQKQNEKCKGLLEIFQALELSQSLHETAQKTAVKCGLDFFSTPLSADWVKNLAGLNTEFFKIASGDLMNYELLQTCISHKNIPLIISTGAALLADIEKTVSYLHFQRKTDVLFLHCVSLYPTPPEKANIARIQRLKELTGALVGFSDHTAESTASFGAVCAGARVIEKHFTLDRNLPGPDQKISADPATIKDLRKKIDEAFNLCGEGKDSHPEEFASDFFGKRALYITGNGIRAMRPKDPSQMPAEEYFTYLHERNT